MSRGANHLTTGPCRIHTSPVDVGTARGKGRTGRLGPRAETGCTGVEGVAVAMERTAGPGPVDATASSVITVRWRGRTGRRCSLTGAGLRAGAPADQSAARPSAVDTAPAVVGAVGPGGRAARGRAVAATTQGAARPLSLVASRTGRGVGAAGRGVARRRGGRARADELAAGPTVRTAPRPIPRAMLRGRRAGRRHAATAPAATVPRGSTAPRGRGTLVERRPSTDDEVVDRAPRKHEGGDE